MSRSEKESLSRRDALKLAGAGLAGLAFTDMTGCATAEYRNVPAVDYRRDLILENCRVIDVKTGKIHPSGSLRIRKGRIHALTADKGDTGKASAVDARGAYVIPGLIDAHCHSTISPVFGMNTLDLLRHLKMQRRQYELCIESGVTTIRDTGAFPGALQGFLRDIRNGKLKGPRVVYCNSLLNVQGGHPDVNPTDINLFAKPVSLFIGMAMTNFRDLKEMREIMRENAEGARFIKLTMDNKSVFCRKEDIPAYSDEQLKEIFNFAEKKGLPVAGHCHRRWGFRRALGYPFHSLEHMVSDELLTDREIEQFVRRKTAVVPTMTIAQCYLMEEAFDKLPEEYGRDEFIRQEISIRRNYLQHEAPRHCDPHLHGENMEMLRYYRTLGMDHLWENKKFLVNPHLYFGMLQKGRKNLLRMKEAGVLIGCGIDAGMPLSYFGGLYREMELLSRIGFKPLEVLQTVTCNNARILGLQESIGAVEVGREADLVLLEKNPLKDITAYREPLLVLKEGRLVHGKKGMNVPRARPAGKP